MSEEKPAVENERKPAVYDPDPAAREMETWDQIEVPLELSELCNPSAVKMLIVNLKRVLSEMQSLKYEVAGLRAANHELVAQSADMRVRNEMLKAKAGNTVMEIPGSLLAGYGISLLTSGRSVTTGWVTLILGITILLYVRGAQLLRLAEQVRTAKSEGINDNSGSDHKNT